MSRAAEEGRAGERGEPRRAIAGTAALLSASVILLLGALVALGGIDRAYARAQDQAERAVRALLRPRASPRPAEAEMAALAASLERLDRVALRIELRGSGDLLASAWRGYSAGAREEDAALDRLVAALGLVEAGLAARRDALGSSFLALIGALVVGLLAGIFYVSGLRSRLMLSRIEGEWGKRSLRASLAAEEELKRRIARELHDDAAQDLAAAKLLCERVATAPESAASRAGEAAALLGEAGRKLRGLALDLRPPQLESAGLAGALESLCARASRPAGLQVAFSCAGELPRIADATAIQAFRIVQEALANARKHAPGHLVEVSAAAAEAAAGPGVVVAVRDYPVPAAAPGPAPDRLPDPSSSSGMGLGIMRERAALAGCGLELEIAPEGSLVRLFIPAEVCEGGAS